MALIEFSTSNMMFYAPHGCWYYGEKMIESEVMWSFKIELIFINFNVFLSLSLNTGDAFLGNFQYLINLLLFIISLLYIALAELKRYNVKLVKIKSSCKVSPSVGYEDVEFIALSLSCLIIYHFYLYWISRVPGLMVSYLLFGTSGPPVHLY